MASTSIGLRSPKARSTARWLILLLCFFQMLDLIFQFSRHWHTMAAHTHLVAVALLCAYWVPAAHVWRKQTDPLALAVMVYVLLAASNLLLFTVAR